MYDADANKCFESSCGLNFNVDTAPPPPPEDDESLVLLGKVTEAKVQASSGNPFIIELGFHKLTVPSNNPPANIPVLLTLLPSIPEVNVLVPLVLHAIELKRVDVLSDPSSDGVLLLLLSCCLVMLRSYSSNSPP